MKRISSLMLWAGTLATAVSLTRSAAAYNWITHRQFVFEAVEVMRSGLVPPAPAGVSAQEWAEYLGAVQAAPARLEQMTTGLPENTAADFTGLASPTSAFPSDAFPFDLTTDLAANKSFRCAVMPAEQRNLTLVGSMTIKGLEGYDVRRNASPCGLEPALVGGLPDPAATLPSVLGWHAGSVDDHARDAVFWFRPTAAGAWGIVIEGASRVAAVAAGALIAPLKCLYDLFSSGDCDLEEGYDLGKKYNPVDYATGWIPGVGAYSDGTTSTVWHFQHVDGLSARFNDTRGLLYEHAGPHFPSATDVGIMVGADVSGMSLNPWASDGVSLYGSLDEVTRGKVVWGAHTIGHTEFSPLDKMAMRGWQRFAFDGRTNAVGLAWPLHAIGDASAPHHVAGTTGWGHRAFENFVDHNQKDLFVAGDVAKQQRVLVEGFYWWKLLQDSNGDISGFIKQLARNTRSRCDANTSQFYQAVSEDDTAHYGATEIRALISPLLEQGSAATLGMLTHVGIRVVAPYNLPNTMCPGGTSFVPAKGCVAPTTIAPPISIPVSPAAPVCSGGCGGAGGAGGAGGGAAGSGGTAGGGAAGAGGGVGACGASLPCTTDAGCQLVGAGNRCRNGCCEFFVP